MITRNLSRGSSGSDVIALQQLFISNGMIPSSLVSSPSGYFGALTEIAVQQWQAAHGLATDGTPTTTGYGAVGPRTRASLANCRS
jgi:peptidoglycan hydrolase-like protein with peptidoglycan-binding domain